MSPIKIIFFDIDETLYIKEKMTIPASIAEKVLPALKAKGIIPAIATGRGFGAFPHALKPLLNKQGFELFVTINGQYNFYKEQIISQYPLEIARIEQVINIFNQLGIIYACVSHDEIALSATNEEVHQAITPIKADYIIDPEFYLKQPIMQLLAFYPESQDQQVLDSGILGDDLKVVRWHPFGVDLLNKHNSKARGIKDVLKALGFNIENAMAFGDGLNDIEMLSAVGLGVAMGNAEETLKQVADYVTAPIDQDGILKALEHFGIIK